MQIHLTSRNVGTASVLLFLLYFSFACIYCTGANSQSSGRCAQELDDTADVQAKVGSFKPQCTDKGHYQLIQRHGSSGYSWCVNPVSGVKIEHTEVAPGQGEPACPACVSLLSKALDKILIGGYRPQCDTSGRFKRVQISASTGTAWCADPETGEKLTNPQRWDGTLKCSNTKKARQVTGRCAQELEATADVLGSFKPACTEKGHYQLVQRHGSTGYSWCVNPTTGVKIEGTDVAPGQGDPQCPACVTLLAKANDQMLIGAYRPQCDGSGLFKPLQFSASTGLAWCADRGTGKQLTTPQRNDGTLNCNNINRKKRQVQKGACAQELEATSDIPAQPGAFKPKCTNKGDYELIQRHGSSGYSWCVNPTTGVKIEHTEVAPGKGQPKCPACVVRLAKANGGMLIGAYRPQCDSTGNFNPIQINGSTGFAWCVDPKTGKKIGKSQRNDGTLTC